MKITLNFTILKYIFPVLALLPFDTFATENQPSITMTDEDLAFMLVASQKACSEIYPKLNEKIENNLFSSNE